jgi:pimeloyl-ACP methyl ester carboxylesterase
MAASVANGWGSRPVELWGMNYPGCGGSEGPTRVAAVGPDALAVYDALRQPAGSRPIYIDGSSLGTTAALCVAAQRPVAGLILRNPPPLRQLILGHYGWWNLWLLAIPTSMQIPAELDSIANAARCRSPAIFVLSGADQVVPPRYHRMVVNAYSGPKQIIDVPGASHNDPLPKEAGDQLQRAMDWLMPLESPAKPSRLDSRPTAPSQNQPAATTSARRRRRRAGGAFDPLAC